MRRTASVLFLFCYSLFGQAPAAPVAPPAARPKLVVAIIVDQFRYDYLQRFRSDYTAGLKRLVDQGAVFDEAHYIHAGTETAPGHSTFLSGATPSVSGIVANEWYDRKLKVSVTSVEDPTTKVVGGVPDTVGASPANLMVETLGDEIRKRNTETGAASRIIGVSFKDRAAILPGAKSADGAYWWDVNANTWVTSTYYMKSLPGWVADINRSRPWARALGEQWMPLDAKKSDKPFCTMVAGVADIRYCSTLMATPWGNELIEEFAERAIVEEKLGRHDGTDLLTVSFSSNDAVGHAVGPDAPEVRDISRRTDILLGKLLDTLDKSVGLNNVVLVLTADHGVAPMAPVDGAPPVPGAKGGRLSTAKLAKTVQDALTKQFGAGDWVEANTGTMMVLRRSLADKLGADWVKVQQAAAEAARTMPHIARVYTDADFQQPAGAYADDIEEAMRRSYYHGRSPDLMILAEQYYNFDPAQAVHGTPYEYDTHVPVIFFGAGIKPGHYADKIAPNDIAPTLAEIVGVPAPSGAVGHALRQVLALPATAR